MKWNFWKRNKKEDEKSDEAANQAPAAETAHPLDGEALIKRRRDSIIHIIYWALILIIIYLVGRYAIGYLAPFLIGFAIALILRPVIVWLRKKLKIKHNIVAIVVVTLFYSTIGVILALLLISLITSLINWLPSLGDLYTNNVNPALKELVDSVNNGISGLDPDVANAVETILSGIVNSLGHAVSTFTDGAVTWLSGFLAGIPGFLLNILFTIIFTFFISMDFGNTTRFIMRQLPERAAGLVRDIKHTFGHVIWKFIRSYSLILLITFIELSIGLLILGVGNPFLIAFLIGLFDLLPIVGTGTVVIPWALITMLIGNTWLGIGLLIMYAIIFVVRNVIEPRIVGRGVGIHPVATLLAIFVGAKLFGAIGLFGAPMTLAILKSLNDRKVIRIYK